MLKELALKYYNTDFGCAQCILYAAKEYYNLNLTSDALLMCSGLNNGLGTGTICGAALACVMVLSILAKDENELLTNRLCFLNEFYARLGALNCGSLKKNDCSIIIEASCDILEDIVSNSNTV